MGSNKGCAGVLAFFFILPMVIYGITAFVVDVRWEQQVRGHIKRAADANTVELALQEMQVVTKYLEDHNVTKGYTGVIYNTPHEDVGFWYQNLKQSEAQLVALPKTATQSDKDTLLLKLRQTLLDHSRGHEKVTEPYNVLYFPNNATWLVFEVICWIFLTVGVIILVCIFIET